MKRTDDGRVRPGRTTRRGWLAAVATAATGSLAGCGGGADGADGADGETPATGSGSHDAGPSTTISGTTVGATAADGTTPGGTPQLPDGEWRLPEYVDRSAFSEAAVTVAGETCDLPGRLSLPRTDDPVPGAVIVHGSGPQDRDGTTGAVRPYRDLAWGLASRGVAVLRYDKVTAACPGALSSTDVDSVVVDDAVAAVDRLERVEGVTEVAVVGHSLGGGMTPRILRRAEGPAGGIALAATARPLYVVLAEQIRALQRADGDLTNHENETYRALQTGLDRVEAGEYDRAAETFAAYGLTEAFVRSIAEYDRFAAARATSVPLSFAQGSADAKVSPERDFERWRTELSGRPNTRFQLYDGLNHLFTPSPGGLGRGAYADPSTVAERVVADCATWIRG